MKLLRRFCSEQVQILLERMDDHWEAEFDLDDSKWDPMLPRGEAYQQYTWVERKCIRHTSKKQTVKLKRERAYVGILERTISPAKTRWEFNRGDAEQQIMSTQAGGTGFSQPSYFLTSTAMVKQMEAMLGSQYQQNLHQNLQQEIRKSMLQGIPQ
jgi:hypothetical protein